MYFEKGYICTNYSNMGQIQPTKKNRQVIVLHWLPGKNWEELSGMPSAIDMGICGDWGYYTWEMSNKMEVSKNDVFIIYSSKCKTPKGSHYDWLQHMGVPVGPFSGLCFLGTINDVSINDAGNQEIGLYVLFGVLPGVGKTIELRELKKVLPSIDWDGNTETILDDKEGGILISLVRDWLQKEKNYLERNPYTNIIDRDINAVIEEGELNDLCIE